MFSLRTLFVVIAVSALGVAALVANTYWLIAPFVLFALAILGWAFLERRQAFWRALLVFGTIYMAIATVDWFYEVRYVLPSMWVGRAIKSKPGPHSVDANSRFGPPIGPRDPLADPFADDPTVSQRAPPFVTEAELLQGKFLVLHCAGALLFGVIGGMLYQWRTKNGDT